MPTPEVDHQDLWQAQEDEPMRMTGEEVCVRARAFEKKSAREYRITMVMMVLICFAFASYLVRFTDPLIRVACGSLLATFLYICARAAHHRPAKKLDAAFAGDTCANYLRAGLEKKKEWVLELRLAFFLGFPAVVAFWWGGGPVAVAKWVGIDTPWLTRYQESLAPLILMASLLVANWVACGIEARNIGREIRKLEAD